MGLDRFPLLAQLGDSPGDHFAATLRSHLGGRLGPDVDRPFLPGARPIEVRGQVRRVTASGPVEVRHCPSVLSSTRSKG
jgi:hypothetical protein